MFFRKKQPVEQMSDTEYNFKLVLEIVKDLDKSEFKKFQQALELAWSGYDKLLRVQTREQKETREIADAEKEMEFMQ